MAHTITESLKRQLEQLFDERDRLVKEYAYVFSSYAFLEKAIVEIRAAIESLEKKDVHITVREGSEQGGRERWHIRTGNRGFTTHAPTFRSRAGRVIEAAKGIESQTEAANPKKEDVAAFAAAYLMGATAPVPRAELYEQLEAAGMGIHGKDPEMVLSTMLWRAGEKFGIYNVKGKGYWLESRRSEIETAFD